MKAYVSALMQEICTLAQACLQVLNLKTVCMESSEPAFVSIWNLEVFQLDVIELEDMS